MTGNWMKISGLFLLMVLQFVLAKERPNIIFILADDLGWNDVSFHGSSQIPTPNIDALAFSGIILNRYYVTPICTPSRSSLMTGKLPIHTGMQHAVLYGAEPRGLPLKEKLLPEYLRELGYSNHIVGKWHLGHWKKVYTPLYRGFDTHAGPWTGHHDYFDHTAMESGQWGLDMRNGMDVAYDWHGRYTTDLITEEAVNVIHNRNSSMPLFLYVAHTAVHSSNPYSPLPAPDETVDQYSYIENYNRRKFAAMLHHLDQSVGTIVEALSKVGILENSIIVFSTDNGGPAEGFNLNAASNYPLKGVKNTLWEGGVRGAGLLWSPMLDKVNRVSNQTMHISDWLPTLYSAAGGNISALGQIDGFNQWGTLSADGVSPRTDILHNIDDIFGSSALTVDQWKLLKGTNYQGKWDNWFGPAGDRNPDNYSYNDLIRSKAGKALKKANMMPTNARVMKLRDQASVQCNYKGLPIKCNPLIRPCLFNIIEDPCEIYNLADENPEIVETMLNRLEKYNITAIPPGNLPLDPMGFPKYFQHTWTNFGDFQD